MPAPARIARLSLCRICPWSTKPSAPTSGDTPIASRSSQLSSPRPLQIDGVLLSLECTHGMTLRVRTAAGTVEFHTDNPSTLEFVSYTAAVTDAFTCGSLKSELPVVIAYRPGGDQQYAGEPVRVDFVDRK